MRTSREREKSHSGRQPVRLAGLLACVALVLLACEGARSIPNKNELYIFDPFTLQTQALSEEMLTPVPNNTERKVIAGTHDVVTDEDALFRLADTLVHRDKTAAFRLRYVNFDWSPCGKVFDGVGGANVTYLAEGVNETPGFPFEYVSLDINIPRGSLSYWSSFVQPHDPLVQGPLLSVYPPPVPYRRVMQIALDSGGKEAVQRIGPTCKLGATLRGDTWTVVWFAQDVYRSDPLLVQEIDANTGEVRKVEWREDKK